MKLSDNGVGLALMTSGVTCGLPVVVITYAALPNSTRPILFLVMFPAVTKGVV
jgi:hypothetical protein